MAASTDISCSVPALTLVDSFGLSWGSEVFANVIATNIYGDSDQSADGNGAVIVTSPDAPTDLAEVYEQRTKSTLGLTWTSPIFVGGTAILDYSVLMAEQGKQLTLLQSGVTDTNLLVQNLSFGTTYEF
jgi:hypothetical protein